MKTASLRVRLLLATGVALLLGLIVVDVITYALVARSQLSQVDDDLQRASSPTRQLASADPGNWERIPDITPGLFVAILDSEGQPMFTAAAKEAGESPIDVSIESIDLDRKKQSVSSSDDDDMRLRVERVSDNSILVIGKSLHEIEETKTGLLTVLITASVAAIAAVLLLAWWLVNVGLRPLRLVEKSAIEITDSGLDHQRVPGAEQNNEIGSLARALNAMLNRLDVARVEREENISTLEASEARMRQFVADASHELRTPIAAVSAYAQLFEHGTRNHPDDLERSMKGIQDETTRMTGLVGDLLLLARLDEQLPLQTKEVDLTELVLVAVETAKTLEPERQFIIRIDDVITLDGDATRLRQVIDNLIANVRTHTAITVPCEIKLTSTEHHATLMVSDTGSGVSDQALKQLGNRFYRIDDARERSKGGNGLGLSIAKAIVAAHSGTLEAKHNKPTGLTIEVRLPRN